MRIEDVHAIQLRRAQVNHETYKGLFEACCKRIRGRVDLPKAPQHIHYAVPAFVWGRPPFKHSHALRYVSEKLRRNGFQVSESAPGVLHVQWPRPRAAAAAAKRATKPKKAKPGATKTAAKTAAAKTSTKLSARLAALRKQLGA